MKLNYKQLGTYIEQYDIRAKEGDYTLEDIRGISSITKEFNKTKANLVDVTVDKYKIVPPNYFAYNPNTARMGDKIPIALNKSDCDVLVSSIYPVFKIDETQLLAEYALLWFKRPEFDRYARYKSHGSAREIFDWSEMCKVELPVPSCEEQKRIVESYKKITERIALKKQINDNLVESLSAVYKELFSDVETQYPKVPLQKICSKIGSGATPKGGKTAYIDKGISLIRSTNVFDFRFEYSDLAHINQNQADALANVTVEPNDVLFNITGVSVARCCMVPDDVLPARVNQHVMIVRPIKGENMSYYIMFTLCSTDNKAKLLGIGQSGSTREAINKQELESFEIPLPDDNAINKFGEAAKRVYEYIRCNIKEILALEEMKTVLLAQLSSR